MIKFIAASAHRRIVIDAPMSTFILITAGAIASFGAGLVIGTFYICMTAYPQMVARLETQNASNRARIEMLAEIARDRNDAIKKCVYSATEQKL